MESKKFEIPMKITCWLLLLLSLTWKISKDDIKEKFPQKGRRCEAIEPEEFPALNYSIMIAQNDKEQVVTGLAVVMETPININAQFKISILSANYFKESTKRYVKSCYYEIKICKLDEFFDPANNYFIDDHLIISMEGTLEIENKQSKSNSYQIRSPVNLGEALWSRDDKDFEVEVERKIIKIHKLVIAAKSSVFEKMFQSGMKESKENKVTIIDFHFNTVEIAMKFCYGIEISQLLNVSNAIELLQFGDKYDINDLKDAMEKYLFNQRSSKNIVKILNATVICNSPKLKEQCFNYLIAKKNKFIFINDFITLDDEFDKRLL